MVGVGVGRAFSRHSTVQSKEYNKGYCLDWYPWIVFCTIPVKKKKKGLYWSWDIM